MPEDDTPPKKKQKAQKMNAEDVALWGFVKKSVRPLENGDSFEPHGDLEQQFSNMVGKVEARHRTKNPKQQSRQTDQKAAMPSYTPTVSMAKNRRKPARAEAPVLADFQRRDVRKIVTGHLPIDATLDLHGMTQAKAKPALKRFLKKHQGLGDKVVLVITGKGKTKSLDFEAEDVFYENAREGGVLRYEVPNWLDENSFRDMVISYQTAHRSHGEEGALYIRLRKIRF